MIKKLTISFAALSAIVGLLAGPAGAAASLVAGPSGTGSQDGIHHVTARCTAQLGLNTTIDYMTYVIQGSAYGWSKNASVAIGTTLTCYIRDSVTGATYGSVSRGLPGPNAQVAGTIDVPYSPYLYLCARASAVFSDGGSASYDDC